MTEFEYWQLLSKAIQNVVRHCFRSMLTNHDYDMDDNFQQAVIQKFPQSEGKITIITKKGAQTAIEKYIVKSEKNKLESVEPASTIDGKYCKHILSLHYCRVI